MKISRLTLIFVFMCLAYFSLNAQKGSILIYTKPSNAIVKIDTMRFTQQGKVFDLNAGKYVIKAWAPTTQLVIDTILIRENQLSLFRKKLPLAEEFIAYQKKRKEYLKPMLLTTLIASGTVLLYIPNKILFNNSYKKANDEKESYESAISLESLESHKNNFEKYKKSYERYRVINNTIIISSSILIPLGIIRTIYLRKKNKKPEYYEQTLLSNTQINIGTDYKNSFLITLHHAF